MYFVLYFKFGLYTSLSNKKKIESFFISHKKPDGIRALKLVLDILGNSHPHSRSLCPPLQEVLPCSHLHQVKSTRRYFFFLPRVRGTISRQRNSSRHWVFFFLLYIGYSPSRQRTPHYKGTSSH